MKWNKKIWGFSYDWIIVEYEQWMNCTYNNVHIKCIETLSCHQDPIKSICVTTYFYAYNIVLF